MLFAADVLLSEAELPWLPCTQEHKYNTRVKVTNTA